MRAFMFPEARNATDGDAEWSPFNLRKSMERGGSAYVARQEYFRPFARPRPNIATEATPWRHSADEPGPKDVPASRYLSVRWYKSHQTIRAVVSAWLDRARTARSSSSAPDASGTRPSAPLRGGRWREDGGRMAGRWREAGRGTLPARDHDSPNERKSRGEAVEY